jgi:CBS domain-containing protein
LKAADVMTPNPLAAPADLSVERLLEDWVYPNRCSTFPLLDARGRTIGLVTIARVKRVPPSRRSTTTVSDIACPLAEVVTCAPRDDLVDVVQRMGRSPDQRALVFDGERLVGIISPSDVTRAHEHARLARS